MSSSNGSGAISNANRKPSESLWVVKSDEQSHRISEPVALKEFRKFDAGDYPVYEDVADDSWSDGRDEENELRKKRARMQTAPSLDTTTSESSGHSETSLSVLTRRKVDFLPQVHDPSETKSGVGNPRTNARRQSQWDAYLQTGTNVQASIISGVFKITLHQRARDGETSELKSMLESVPEQQRRRILNASKDEDGVTALHLAARHNHYDVCRLLIGFGSDVDSRAEGKATPLHYAARYRPRKRGNEEIEEYSDLLYVNQHQDRSVIVLLAEHGAHVNLADIEGQTPLHSASIKGNTDAVTHLLRCRGINVESSDLQGMTALHMAATHGHVEIVKKLIEVGSDLHCVDNDLMTPLHFSCSEGNVEIVRMILIEGARQGTMQKVKKMLTKPDAGGNTCLHLSVSKGHSDMVRELMAQYGSQNDLHEFINLARSHNDTSLHIAASQGHLEIARMLADSGSDVNRRNDSLQTPLLLAAQHNHFTVVELLLSCHAELEIRDKDNLTPLLVVTKYGHLETLSWLMENGADITATDKNDKSCLMLAVEEKRTFAVKELLRHEQAQKLLDETDKNANSVLHVAARKGHLPVIRILLENGARIDPKNEDEATPVHIAALYGQHVALKELLDHNKTMLNSVDENANTALHLAATEGHTKCVKVLLDHGANVGLRNTKQWTALDSACAKGWETSVVALLRAQSPVNPPRGSRACIHGHKQVVGLLLNWKADVSAKLVDGQNPLDCAIDKNNRDCVQTILNHHTWKNAMRNAFLDPLTDVVTTPIRKLIIKMPDMAELAFSRCITKNTKAPDDAKLEITLDYEFLDDMYTIPEWRQQDKLHDSAGPADMVEVTTKKSYTMFKTAHPSYEAFTEKGRLHKTAQTYIDDPSMLRHNHPLSIMVNRKREALLTHPVVTALLLYKWKKYGGLVYYSTLVFLLMFVALLNCYLLIVPPPYAVDMPKSLSNRRFYQEFVADHITNYTAPSPCYSRLQLGAEYRGYAAVAESGNPCLDWDVTSVNSQFFPEAGLEKNYCRNPATQRDMPWCYTNYRKEHSVDFKFKIGKHEWPFFQSPTGKHLIFCFLCSNTEATWRIREDCEVEACPIFVTGQNVPLSATCVFPFLYLDTNVSECQTHSEGGLWCAYTYNFDQDGNKWGYCSEEDPRCSVDNDNKRPCGAPGTDQVNCEARDCCYQVHNENMPNQWSECFQKLDVCSDRSTYCTIFKQSGFCVSNREAMEVRCAKTCGFCNETMQIEDDTETQRFLYLMSVYPKNTFEPSWIPGCYYVLPGAQSKWGSICIFKGSWQDPIRITIMALCVMNLALLVLQIWNYQTEAFQPIFFLEIALFVLGLLLAIDFRAFDFPYTEEMKSEEEKYYSLVEEFQIETGLRQNWQWQCGVMALFLSWMDLLLYIRKIPYLGIYVVMFNDVFKTFVKFSLVFLLFILSFAFTYHTLLQNQAQYEQPFTSIIKTTVMMVGEIDFGTIFFGDAADYASKVNYEIVTYLIFSSFIIVMMIIIMNLLVGLAVGDIIEVKDHATLERLKMQVELALEVEFSVPNVLRKRFVRKHEVIYPNKYRKSNPLKRALLQNTELSSKSIISAMNPEKSETEAIRENVSNALHQLQNMRITTADTELLMRDMMTELRELKTAVETILPPTVTIRDEASRRSSKVIRGSDRRRKFKKADAFESDEMPSRSSSQPNVHTMIQSSSRTLSVPTGPLPPVPGSTYRSFEKL